MNANTSIYDVIIVGAGPTGLACAIEAEKKNLNYLVIEKGCLANSIQHFPAGMTFFTTPELLEIGGLPFVSAHEKPSRIEALKYYRRVAESYYLRMQLYETVISVEGSNNNFCLHTRNRLQETRQFYARKLVLATGFYDIPNLLNCPGENLPKVSHYYTEAHPYFNTDVAVIGGKNSAALAALDLQRHGARVTLIHRGSEFNSQIKYWIKPDLENRIKSGAITASMDTTVEAIHPRYLLLRNAVGHCWDLPNDFVFAMTGYRPDVLFFKSMGIETDPVDYKPRIDKETFESNVPGIYLAGVVIGGKMTNEIFIENGRFHGELIIRHIVQHLGKPLSKKAQV